MTAIANTPEVTFSPFFDPLQNGTSLSWARRIGVSLGIGAIYLLLQYYSLPDKSVFFRQYSWVLGIIISTSLIALYIASEVFRRCLITMQQLKVDNEVCAYVLKHWLSDKWYLIAGASFATVNTTMAHLFGIPAEFHIGPIPLFATYLGLFAAGFATGMGVLGIIGIIVLYVRFAPSLQHALDPSSPDGIGGIKKLGDSLWFFAFLIGVIGILVTVYMFGVKWTFAYKDYVQTLFLIWVSLPYILAISIVLIPGLAVRRHVSYYKHYKIKQLKQEKAKLYSSYKKFDAMDDDVIVSKKKELSDRLNKIQDELEKLKKMRSSHIDAR